MRMRRLLGLLAACALLVTSESAADGMPVHDSVRHAAPVKNGAATWAVAGEKQAMAKTGVSWFYDWSATDDGIAAPKGVEFVPMMWGAGSVTKANLAAAKASGSTLLGFNEPDNGGQANMSVADAIKLWPQLEKTKMTLGSPAVAWGADVKGQWLDQFMTQAKADDLRVDFITLHWYGSDFDTKDAVGQLKAYVVATHAAYHLPIWLTEYALMNFGTSPASTPSAAQQARFVTRSTAMLNRLAYVHRYAWFSFPTPTQGGLGTGLYRPGHGLTPMGRAYRR
jgi:hypothetical protein